MALGAQKAPGEQRLGAHPSKRSLALQELYLQQVECNG